MSLYKTIRQGKVVGLLTNCLTKETDIRVYEWKLIQRADASKELRLIKGPSGFESFVPDKDVFRKMLVSGWCACEGIRGKCDRLIVTAEEMRKMYQEVFK